MVAGVAGGEGAATLCIPRPQWRWHPRLRRWAVSGRRRVCTQAGGAVGGSRHKGRSRAGQWPPLLRRALSPLLLPRFPTAGAAGVAGAPRLEPPPSLRPHPRPPRPHQRPHLGAAGEAGAAGQTRPRPRLWLWPRPRSCPPGVGAGGRGHRRRLWQPRPLCLRQPRSAASGIDRARALGLLRVCLSITL